MQEADAARKRLMRASSCVSANADARTLPFMIMQRVCGNVDGASRFRPAIFRLAAHMALEEFATVTNVGGPLAAALVPSAIRFRLLCAGSRAGGRGSTRIVDSVPRSRRGGSRSAMPWGSRSGRGHRRPSAGWRWMGWESRLSLSPQARLRLPLPFRRLSFGYLKVLSSS